MEGHGVPEVRAGHGRARCAGGKGRDGRAQCAGGKGRDGRAQCAGGKGRAWKGTVCQR